MSIPEGLPKESLAKIELTHLHPPDFLKQSIFTDGSPEKRLLHLAQNLPEMLPSLARTAKIEPFPFSGVIAFQAGDGPTVQACHCPNQAEFSTDQAFNALSIGKLFTSTCSGTFSRWCLPSSKKSAGLF